MKEKMPKWEPVFSMIADDPIILKDFDTSEPYLHYKRCKIKIEDLLKLDGWNPETNQIKFKQSYENNKETNQ